MTLRFPAAAAAFAAVAITLLAMPRGAGADELLHVASTVTYDVKASDGPVRITWDVALTNNDPDTEFSQNGAISFYDALQLPVLRGAANSAATDGDGAPLLVAIDDPGPGIAQRARIEFDRPLFFGDTYSFRLTYELPDERSEGILVTPVYAFVPAIAAGDEATVVVNTPAGEPWVVSVEPRDCAQNENTFACSGSDAGYLAAIIEVSQPSATATVSFDVQLEDGPLAVNLTYFQGEDAAAQHQQELITQGLPVIEDVYGFAYAGPALANVSHGGRQSVLGYEGLASCGADACDVVISPIADDYTVLHELAHLWSGIYAKRWLSEGFAELVSREAAARLGGLVEGAPPERPPAEAELQLDDWGETESLIGADEEQLAIVGAGYDYSLRFLDELRFEVGLEALQAVNRNIASSGQAADSRRFMDLLEDASGRNLDSDFLLWVFPSSYDGLLADRREAKERLADLRSGLTDAALPLDITVQIEADIRAWAFDSALAALDAAEANLGTYTQLRAELDVLQAEAQDAGLVLPAALTDDLNQFAFESLRSQMAAAGGAIEAYGSAEEAVESPRNIWERFGLLGSDPDGAVENARNAFANGDFELSQRHSEHAESLIDDASSVAFRRMLVVAGFLGLLVLALAVALGVSRLRERGLA